MGLVAASPPAPLAQHQATTKMSHAADAEDAVVSPLPVSSGAGLLSLAREAAAAKKEASGDDVGIAENDDEDPINFRGRDLPPVGQDPLAAAASAASAAISETAHRAAELTLGALGAPGTTTEDVVRASKEGLWSALAAARTLAAGAVEGTRQQYRAACSAVEAAKEAAAAANGSSDALESYRPGDGSAVLGAFSAELRDEVSSSSSPLFPPARRRIRGSLFVTSSSVQFLVARSHQSLGRAVSRAVTASAAEASSVSLGTASSELGGFLGATLAAEDAERAANGAERAAGLPSAGSVAVIPLGEIKKVEVVEEEEEGEAEESSRKVLVVFVKGSGANSKNGSVKFAAFGASSDAEEALALVEHLLAEGKEAEDAAA